MKHIPVDVVMKYSEELLARYGGKSARELPESAETTSAASSRCERTL